MTARLATTDPVDVADAARLLHDFTTEFATPTPGAAVLTDRLTRPLAGDADARRFYERHGFNAIEPDTGGRALHCQGPVTL